MSRFKIVQVGFAESAALRKAASRNVFAQHRFLSGGILIFDDLSHAKAMI